jgi:hypothetical protein
MAKGNGRIMTYIGTYHTAIITILVVYVAGHLKAILHRVHKLPVCHQHDVQHQYDAETSSKNPLYQALTKSLNRCFFQASAQPTYFISSFRHTMISPIFSFSILFLLLSTVIRKIKI